jgi:hypothetical protein
LTKLGITYQYKINLRLDSIFCLRELASPMQDALVGAGHLSTENHIARAAPTIP